jgi:hypothetical protein
MRHLPIVVLVTALAACGGSSGQQVQQSSRVAPKDINLVTAKELEDPAVQGTDALSALRHLRPGYFLSRPGGSIQNKSAGTVHVSIDGGSLQTVDNLSRYRVNDIAEVRYLNSTDATQRFGTAAGSGGVILVKTR